MRCLLIHADAVFHRSRPLHVIDVEADPGADDTWSRVVRVPGEAWLCLHEARVDEAAPENNVATALAHHTGAISIAHYVTGSALLVGSLDVDGTRRDVPESALQFLRELGCTIGT